MRASGFTMVELLIVAILLAVLAGVVIPQFASSTNEASEAALQSTLERVRSAISFYKAQHGRYPGFRKSSGNGCNDGTPGTGERGTEAAVVEQLTLYSRSNGRVCTLPGRGGFVFGPYLQSATFPVNPVTGSNEIVVVPPGNALAGSMAMAADGAGGGWKYDTVSGRFIANDTATDTRGVAYDQY